jgi:lathosterol oxidase
MIAGRTLTTMDLMNRFSLPEILLFQWMNNVLRYFLVAGLAYLVLWKWAFPRMQSRFLYKKPANKKDLRREIGFSVLSTLVFLVPTSLRFALLPFGVGKLYFSIGERGWAWYILSFFVVFFFHDTYFYWTHRLMHHPRLYRLFHRVHHLSIEPTPLAAFAFHPLEALVESLVFLVLTLVFPLHYSVLLVFTAFSLFMNVYGHLGFSLFRAERLERVPLRWFSHTVHHAWHHRHQRGNYGFYLLFWDRLMGTYSKP